MFATKHKHTRGNKCCQFVVSNKGYVVVYLMKSQDEFETALYWFCKEVGVPVDLGVDGFSSQKKRSVKRFCNQVGATLKILKRANPWENRAGIYIGVLKEADTKHMRESNSPMVLWDYEIQHRAIIHNAVPRPLFKYQGKTPHECTFGYQSDISNVYDFVWHEWVCYRDFVSFHENKEKLGRMLRPCKNEGNEISQSIVASSGFVITRRIVKYLHISELHSKTEKRKRRIFDDIILKKLGDSVAKPANSNARAHVPYSDGVDTYSVKLPEDNAPVMPDRAVFFINPIND